MPTRRRKSIEDIESQLERIIRLSNRNGMISALTDPRVSRASGAAQRYIRNIFNAKSSKREYAKYREAKQRRDPKMHTHLYNIDERKFSPNTYMGLNKG